MRQYGKTFWRSVPFLRLLIPFTTGILPGFYISFPIVFILQAAITFFLLFILFRFLPNKIKYRRRWTSGIFLNLALIAVGILLCYCNDIRNSKDWFGHFDLSEKTISVTLLEPLIEKERSFKATVTVDAVLIQGKWKASSGKLLLYLNKDSIPASLQCGSQLIIHSGLQPIRNTGNPGGFNYRQYCAFQGIYHQAYIKNGDYLLKPGLVATSFSQLLYNARDKVLITLKKYIPGNKETGVAEALLVGYRNDLDKDLVQAYSNTGVVHIIAISGLHLGMIYGLLAGLFKLFPANRITRWAKPLVILLVLWGFSLLTGAAASILRSAVMFTFIVIGGSLGRKTNVYNTLAASAFFLLLYNPYFLWDVGFLLSYTAVLSIVLFMRPVYKWFYIKNRLLNNIWQLNAVTISAQVLTLPLVLFCFHQFPNLFLFTNGVAVPLSGLILYLELLLLMIAPLPFINTITGQITSFLIRHMNGYIERTAALPFAVTDNIDISLLQVVTLYLLLAAIAWWLLHKRSAAFCMGLFFFAGYMLQQAIGNVKKRLQHKLIIYNIPKQSVMDIVEGSSRLSRIRLEEQPGPVFKHTLVSNTAVTGYHSCVLVIKEWHLKTITHQKPVVDVIILSGNPNVSLPQLAAFFNCTQYVFDSSNPLWKIERWKKEAGFLHLRHHSTSEQGAFEVDL